MSHAHHSANIVENLRFNCPRTRTKVNFMVKEILHLEAGSEHSVKAYVPSCNGARFCGVFPQGFPHKLADVPVTENTGCPFFDARITGGLERHHGHE
jgi:hypothetical protein